MAIIQSQYGTTLLPAPIPVAQEILSVKTKVNLTAAQVALGNVITSVILPADCVPVAYTINAGKLDSGAMPAIAFNFGVLNAAKTALDITLQAGSLAAQAGGLVLHNGSKASYDTLDGVTSTDKDRMLATIITVAAATAQAGFIEVELFYKAV